MMAKAARAAAAWRTYREVTKPGSPGLMTRVRAIPRMIGAVTRGRYEGLGKGKLALMAMGVVYMISPIDVVPDFLVLIGVADDFGVFLWLMASLLGESGRYVDWERKVITGRVETRPQEG
ncbi:YkvA family protein [Nonomuraea sp. MCN248]|uniref:YkvA family protein n=1 Tax=Nonomuraea corallina TaxID=2989783 RepID=A0ABT4S8Y1_9ACTN|nr:YkvA family protein [Nonomuraea corallina]MDA0633386.1 YkvA family protein [Nonomuraea corallina]